MKKTYEIPSVEMTLLLPDTIVLAGSPGAIQNSGQGTDNISGYEGPVIVGG